MKNKLKLGQKLIGSFLIVALIAAVIGAFGIVNMKKVNNSDTFLYENMTLPLGYVINIAVSFERARINVRDLIDAGTDEERMRYSNTINEMSKIIVENAAKYEKTMTTESGKKVFNNFIEARKVYRGYLDEVIALIKDGKVKEARGIVEGVGKDSAFKEQEAIDKLAAWKIMRANQTSDANTKTAFFSMMIMIIIIMFGALAAIILGIILTRSITRAVGGEPAEIANIAERVSLGDLEISFDSGSRKSTGIFSSIKGMVESLKYKADVLEKIADGDLTEDVKVASDKDRLGKSLLKMVESLNITLSQVYNSVEQTASGSNQVASASQSLSQGATEQASSLEEITSSITEINSQAKQNAENALQASALSKKALENSDMGNRQMKDLVESMTNITKSAEMIKKIVKVIDDIAFQTNLLALNANVEAARAGKYGKGFAVVAEEVRNLAGRSAESVKETTAMVEEAVKNIMNGNNLVEVTAKQLDDIATSSNKVADLVEGIATASKEQTQGLEEINQGLGQMDQVTQANTANAEESASAAEELASQAEQLKAIVSQFKLNEIRDENEIEDKSGKKINYIKN